MPGALFFVDRSLGRVRVPALLRENGWALVTLAEHYGVPQDQAVDDVAWLRLAGERGWPVLMKDERIKYRTAERRALIVHGVRAFCLTSGNLDAQADGRLLCPGSAKDLDRGSESGSRPLRSLAA